LRGFIIVAGHAGYQIRTSTGLTYSFGAQSLAAGELLAINQATLGFRPADGASLFLATPTSTIGDATVVKNTAQARSNSGAWLVPSAASPGTANAFSLNTSIVINEVMYHHHSTFLATGTTPVAEEWVELYNRSGSAVVLTGWKLRGGISYDFPAGTQIAAGGYLVCANDPAALLAKFPSITIVGPFTGSLSNSDDTVRLDDASGNPASEVRYFSGGRWDERADGSGSSLELRNPAMDPASPESWAASNESPKASWTTISYSGLGASFPGTYDPNGYHEFILGLTNGGECLVDDVSVREVSVGNREVIQNGSFATTAKWRNLGNHGSHGRTIIVPDPIAPTNSVLKIVATGATEHMHNHCETTFANGITINPASTYTISFRARWVSGCPRLQSRLYFNRLARQHLLPMPANTGTPGAANSRFAALTGPTFSGLSHSPTLPSAQQAVAVRIAATDPQGIASVALKWKLDGSTTWNSSPMVLSNGIYEGQIPGQAVGALVQFYAEASDGTTAATFPADGTASRAYIRWRDEAPPLTPGHGFRILMSTADANFMHSGTNVMSNDTFPCTVVYRENEVFYDARVRLRSSQRGRLDNSRIGFAIEFDPMHLFRGAHSTINTDRSGYGRGTTGTGNGHSEIISWHMFNRAAGIPSMYNDMIYVFAPREVHNGSAILTMAEFNDVWADSQYDNGASFPSYKYELIYYPTTTDDGTPEGLKIANPDEVNGVEFGSITSPDKEAFRWNFLIGNARGNDDFTRLINLSNTYQLSGTAFNNAIVNAIDVDQWLRASAALALCGIGDSYSTSSGAWHNLKLYNRPDGRMLYLPWDLDFQDRPYYDSLIINPNIYALTQISPAYQRLFYQHLDNLIKTSFNSSYLSPWVSHYASFNTSGGNWNEITSYVDQRVAYVRGEIANNYPVIPFNITTTGFSTSANSTIISGTGWIDIRTIVTQPGGLQVPVTWTSGTTWQAVIPVFTGSQTVTLQALDRQGNMVGSGSVTGFGTGSAIPAAAGNIVISEIHYKPAAPTAGELTAANDKDEFEFVEIRNISPTQTVSLAGCRFTGVISYTFPNTTLAPGAFAVVPRNSAAFAARYSGVAALASYYAAGANFLSNSGGEIALIDAAAADITRVIYDDSSSSKWPSSPDGGGTSLVLIAPLTNPLANNPLHWRASSTIHGNPGTSDALPAVANPSGDSNSNGISNLTEHAIGLGKVPAAGIESPLAQAVFSFTIERNPLADVDWSLETHTTLNGPWTAADAAYEITSRSNLANGVEKIVLRSLSPLSSGRGFTRAKLSVP
jgi:Lamin Tail Domain/CotH kinase protein